MRNSVLKKFNQFMLNPDFANKFLISSLNGIPKLNNQKIYLMYIFRQKTPYSFIAIKSLIMLGSLNSKICQTKTKIILLKFSKPQSHSIVFMTITFKELLKVLPLYYKKPVNIKKAMTSYISESQHFVFPGYVKHLKIPSWKHNLKISFQGNQEKNYWFFFFKTIYFD